MKNDIILGGMKKTLIILLTLLTGSMCRADVKYIDFHKVDPAGKYSGQARFLIEDLPYYDHWSPQWIYETPKDSLIRELKGCLAIFAALKGDELESDLLLGEIAHYLYNLDQQPYYDTAEAYYLKAIGVSRSDCRCYWFLGYHYVLSNEVPKGVQAFESARKLYSDGTPVEFWQEYADAMLIAGMPSHCRYALDKFRPKGKWGLLATIIDSTLRVNYIQADPDSTYTDPDIWQAYKLGKRVSFIARPLGMKMEIDSNWNLQLNGFTERQAVAVMTPGILTSTKGKRVGYNIVMIVKAAKEGEKLDDFMKMFMKPGAVKDAVSPFSETYPGGVSYTARDKTVYAANGGAHIHFIGFERKDPANPGMALEEHAEDLKGEPGKLQFYSVGLTRNRFSGRLFYFFLLDTCEDIHEKSWNVFRELLTKQMVIE